MKVRLFPCVVTIGVLLMPLAASYGPVIQTMLNRLARASETAR